MAPSFAASDKYLRPALCRGAGSIRRATARWHPFVGLPPEGAYEHAGRHESRFFSAIILNMLFAIGTDVGLGDHGDETRGCIMDFCDFMPDIEVAISQGPTYCKECTTVLLAIPTVGRAVLALPRALKGINIITAADRDVTRAVLLRGRRYSVDTEGFDYDIALSFSGSDRGYAEELASHLKLGGVSVFYDLSEQADLWGRNLQIHLLELYRLRQVLHCLSLW